MTPKWRDKVELASWKLYCFSSKISHQSNVLIGQ